MSESITRQYMIKILYYTTNKIQSILQIIYSNQQSEIVHVPIDIDLASVAKSSKQATNFIVGEFPSFLKLLNKLVFQIAVTSTAKQENTLLKKKMQQIHEKDINCLVNFVSCPLPRKDLQSSELNSELVKLNEGILVYLKDILVLETYHTEVFLFSWTEKWKGCLCRDREYRVKNNQTLLDVAKEGRLKERAKKVRQRCDVCDIDFKDVEISDEVYLSCQKIKIFCDMKQHKSKACEQIFNQSIFEVYLNTELVNKINVGDYLDFCCYYYVLAKIRSNISACNRLKCDFDTLLICLTSYPCKNFQNNKFFSHIRHIRIKYQPSQDINNYLQHYYNYSEIINGINQIQFPYCYRNTFTLLKLGVLASIFLKHRANVEGYTQPNNRNSNLHMLVISEQEQIVSSIIQLPNLKIRVWPNIYDHNTVSGFIFSCYNSILLMVNPTKKQIAYINQITEGIFISDNHTRTSVPINITLWVVINPAHKTKDFPIEQFDIVLDVTFLNNGNERQVEHDISGLIDQKLHGFTASRQLDDENMLNNFLVECFEQDSKKKTAVREQKIAYNLLEKYYIKARQYKKTTIGNFISLEKTANAISLLRRFLCKFSQRNLEIAIIDVILAIFLEEETSRNKKGNSNTILANEVGKFMLNESDHMEILEFQYSEEIEEIKRNLPKSEYFIRILRNLGEVLDDATD